MQVVRVSLISYLVLSIMIPNVRAQKIYTLNSSQQVTKKNPFLPKSEAVFVLYSMIEDKSSVNIQDKLEVTLTELISYKTNALTLLALVDAIDIRGPWPGGVHTPGTEDLYPAVSALKQVGTQAIPFIIKRLASREAENGKNNEFVKLFSFSTRAVYTLGIIVDARAAAPKISLLNQYANEYELQAMRLRLLAEQIPDAPPIKAVEIKPAGTEEEQIARLARIFELQDLIQNEKLTTTDEAKITLAIAELGQLGAVEAASTLADKLDWQRPPAPSQKADLQKVDPYAGDTFAPMPAAPEVMSADPKGLLSPKVTQAAMKALGEIGAPALPAIIEAVSQRRRLPRFRDNAITLVVQLSGGKVEGIAAMNKAAEDNDKKVKRLRELATSLIQPN